MLTKLVSTFTLGLIISTSLSAQESKQSYNAYGVQFKQPDNLSFLYKKQIVPNTYRRFNLLFFRTAILGNSVRQSAHANLGFSIAKERHQKINNKLSFYKGWEYGASASLSSIFGERNAYNLAANLGYLIGFEYRFTTGIAIGLELLPQISLQHSKPDLSEGHWRFNANLNTTNIGINLIYYFNPLNTSQT